VQDLLQETGFGRADTWGDKSQLVNYNMITGIKKNRLQRLVIIAGIFVQISEIN